MRPLQPDEVFGFVRPAVDAHTLGISAAAQLLADCGYRVCIAGADVCAAAGEPSDPANLAHLEGWIRREGIARLGFSYRLDPEDGARAFGRMLYLLGQRGLLADGGGPVMAVGFAGLPDACERVRREHGDQVTVFHGDETPAETLVKMGVPESRIPREVGEGSAYDEQRMAFARDLLAREAHDRVPPPDRRGYPGFGTRQDRVVDRVAHAAARGDLPLMRAHVGPYLPDRVAAVALMLDWAGRLARSGYLDVLSLGTSQLTQACFGEDWGGLPNGGGVPVNSPWEYRAIWETARPMLVRTYAGTRSVPDLARLHEETLNIAWHALSFWWFSQMDGRGPNSVRQNLGEHAETLRYIAGTDKPFEPNIPHHFAFRGADDVTYVVSAVLAARAAKALGIRHLVLQVMLNTPRSTWGIQDLAKARAALQLVRELEDGRFTVLLQPRAGLDYLSADLDKARAQLAAASALMDDIEPHNPSSPHIVHVVSYSEASHLADPDVVDESIRITRAAIQEYRSRRTRGAADDMARHPEAVRRTEELVDGARALLAAIEGSIPSPYTPEGLYTAFAAGFLPVPYLWECREEFPHAVRRQTRLYRGGVHVVDENGLPVPPARRAAEAAAVARALVAQPAGAGAMTGTV